MGDCVFCDIVERQAGASLVHEDATVVAVMDLQPVTEGHVLVLPRAHLPYLADVPPELAARTSSRSRSTSPPRCAGRPCGAKGVDLFLADGEAASQEVPHAHLHGFPRYAGDGFRIEADWRVRPRAELDAAAAHLRAALG